MLEKNRINAFGYFGLIIVWIVPIFFIISLFRDIFDKPFNLLGLTGALCVIGLLAFPSFLITVSIYWQYSTEITALGLTRKFLWINKTIRWEEIEHIQSTIFRLTLITKKESQHINLALFTNSKEIIESINNHLENSTKKKTLAQ